MSHARAIDLHPGDRRTPTVRWLRYFLLSAGILLPAYALSTGASGRFGFAPYGVTGALLCALAWLANRAAIKAASKHPHELFDE